VIQALRMKISSQIFRKIPYAATSNSSLQLHRAILSH